MSALPYYQLKKTKPTIANYFKNFFEITGLIILRVLQMLFFFTIQVFVFLLVYMAIESIFTGREMLKLLTK